ncbi:MAG: hypothetical protein LW834_19355, partial [Cyanobium sp. 49614_E6]|nr:hypothetical protein [Cyanobium sp. 49614_E6]
NGGNAYKPSESVNCYRKMPGALWICCRSIRRLFLELLRGSSGQPSIKSKLLGLDPARRLFKSVATIFWVCVIHAALSLLNVVLFERPF